MIQIIPAMDIISGECVRLTKGDYSTRKSYSGNPLEMAERFCGAGLKRLHIVDLDGARASFPENLHILEKIISRTGMEIEWGGGIKNRQALDAVLDSGASQAICGSIAVSDPDEFRTWLSEYGPDRIILGADVRNGMIATHGWMQDSSVSVEDLVERFLPFGLSRVICTDIACDGMLCGPSLGLYAGLLRRFPELGLTASGGIGSMEDIISLDRTGIGSVIVGKAIYEGRISLEEIEEFNSKQENSGKCSREE